METLYSAYKNESIQVLLNTFQSCYSVFPQQSSEHQPNI